MNDSCSRKTRIVLHVDMDHFFSAVEERENPQIKGNPVVVGATRNTVGAGAWSKPATMKLGDSGYIQACQSRRRGDSVPMPST